MEVRKLTQDEFLFLWERKAELDTNLRAIFKAAREGDITQIATLVAHRDNFSFILGRDYERFIEDEITEETEPDTYYT